MIVVQKNFVKIVRAIELILGVPVPGLELPTNLTSTNYTLVISTILNTTTNDIFTPEIKSVLQDSVPILVQLGTDIGIFTIFDFSQTITPLHSRDALVTK